MTMKRCLLLGIATALSSATPVVSANRLGAPTTSQRSLSVYPTQPFSFDAPFGDNMVLQHGQGASSRAAIYGFMGPHCASVQVDLFEATPDDTFGHIKFSTSAAINVTQQPFNPPESSGVGSCDGDEATQQLWGPRPCTAEGCPDGTERGAYRPVDRRAFNPWNQPLPTWKVWLPSQPAGGNYTILATCTKTQEFIDQEEEEETVTHDNNEEGWSRTTETISITNVTFGDVWYCSGQSNMQLKLAYTFQKYETAQAIMAGKYNNIRLMAGESAHRPWGADHIVNGHYPTNIAQYGSADGTNPWMTARQAVGDDVNNLDASPWMQFGATCWHFAQGLVEQGLDENMPIGLINTAIGGKRIQEFISNSTISQCRNRTRAPLGDHADNIWFESLLYGQQVLPFVDMTIKGWVWYQGENNMYEVKGNSKHNVGYSCELKALIRSWRQAWSETADTTPPNAPFGIVTLASSGSEGGPDMGAMRYAQTMHYGVLPPPHVDEADEEFFGGLDNVFIAQSYDMEDEWLGESSPCFAQSCCTVTGMPANHDFLYDSHKCTNEQMHIACNSQEGACSQTHRVNFYMGNIHPRSKKQVGDRLATAAYNVVYGGQKAYTGPTLQGCSVTGNRDHQLEIRFNETMMRGERLGEPIIPPLVIKPPHGFPGGGSQLYVQIDASQFCLESHVYKTGGVRLPLHSTYVCPEWAGGDEDRATNAVPTPYEQGWIHVPFTLKPGTTNTILADLSQLPEGATPTAVRYAWGLVDCCDHSDPELFVTKSCIANCPLYLSESKLPANPFMAKIVDGQCECVAPQFCTDHVGEDEDAGVHS